MPPKPLFDISTLDLEHIEFGIDEIRRYIPQRYEFEQLTAVNKCLPDDAIIVGHRRIDESEFWVRGHIPGNPLFPGVLMLEAAAQLCSVYQGRCVDDSSFFAFGGISGVKFRGVIRPGDCLVLVCKGLSIRPRRSTFACQGFVRGTLVFEAEITGVRMEREPSPHNEG